MKFPAPKVCCHSLVLLVLCASGARSFALDREAFSIPSYNLHLQIDPEQHRLGARGKVTLRNDSPAPQKIAVLQISSSLDWRAIKAGDKAVQFVRQPYTSDIDHTGGLSEAIVTLPQEVAPHGTIDLDIAYEGVILLDATRLTRIGTPDDLSKSTDWDQIGPDFTAVRGAGYVAWYPIATEAANLSEADLFEVLGRWKARAASSEMTLVFESTKDSAILFSGTPNGFVVQADQPAAKMAAFNMIRPGVNVPTFVLADYKKIDVKGISGVSFLPGNDAIAAAYADVLGSLNPLPGTGNPGRLQVAQLPDSSAAPFVSEGLLLVPLKPMTEESRLTLVYAMGRQQARSPRPWIQEGLAHFAQMLDLEQQHGRKSALEYLLAHQSLLADAERHPPSGEATGATENGTPSSNGSLIDPRDDIYLQSKAMWVWSMLRDMVGDAPLNLLLSSYDATADKSISYLQESLNKQTKRDLGWFFDDWVYHDRRLPDFKVESAFARKVTAQTFLVTITVDNLGGAGAEVPLTVKFAGGEETKRLEVRAKSKAVIRVETALPPLEVVVNDGSVPESDMTNNTYKIESIVAK